MQSSSSDHQFAQAADSVLYPMRSADYSTTDDTSSIVTEPTEFRSQFIDCMEMHSDAQTVASYLNEHHSWFRRCAHPMGVELIGANSYALIVGHFGAFGYDIEPKVGLNLLPQQEGIYRIETVPVPGYSAMGYDIDFRAAMELVELSSETTHCSAKTTQVKWKLDLTVTIQFPKFIHALPEALIQHTGDRLLHQVVRQVSRRLTHKVQEDFHSSRSLPMPKRARKWL